MEQHTHTSCTAATLTSNQSGIRFYLDQIPKLNKNVDVLEKHFYSRVLPRPDLHEMDELDEFDTALWAGRSALLTQVSDYEYSLIDSGGLLLIGGIR